MPGQTLTRGEAARRLRTSIASVRRLEESGALVPDRDERGRRLFSRLAVERLAKDRGLSGGAVGRVLDAGEVAARAFELFASRRSLVDVVVELRRPVDELRTLQRIYEEERGGGLLLAGAERRALSTLAGRKLTSGADVLTFVRRLLVAMRRARNGKPGAPEDAPG